MSFVRWGVDGSDVYVFEHAGGYVACLAASHDDREFATTSLEDMLAHLREHRQAGHTVPHWLEDDLTGGWPFGKAQHAG